MSFRAAALAIATLTLCAPAVAQIEDSGLAQVDPWGLGFLEPGEPALPINMWRASNAEDLVPLMRRVRTRGLTPAERTLMRRMALSPAGKPGGDKSADLLAERARIMFELGEAGAAAELMARLSKPPAGMDAAEISADLNLALGNEATACGPDNLSRDGAYWARLRAVCAALSGNASGAELAIEIAEADGVSDPWLFSAVFAASGDSPEPPPGRYDSGLRLAISTAAGLKPPANTISLSRPDLAAAMTGRESLPAALRVRSAGIAAESGLIDTSDYRDAFDALLASEDFQPANSLELALRTAADPDRTAAEKSRAIAIAIRSARGSPAKFSAVSRLLSEELSRLPRSAETAGEALAFAQASLAAGNTDAAASWTGAVTIEGAPESDAFDVAYLDGLTILSGGDTSKASVDHVSDELTANVQTDAQRAAAVRLFSLWTVLDIPPNAEARAMMAAHRPKNTSRIKPTALLSLSAAADAGAAGEVILATVGLTNGDPSKLDPADLMILVDALGKIGAQDVARSLVLEASGYWKAER